MKKNHARAVLLLNFKGGGRQSNCLHWVMSHNGVIYGEPLHKAMLKLKELGLVRVERKKCPNYHCYAYTVIKHRADQFLLSYGSLPRDVSLEDLSALDKKR